MKNKNKLKGSNIFIENNLTWEERNVQEKISRQGKKERSKGKKIKIGLGKIRINGIWKFWSNREGNGDEQERFKRREGRQEG